MTLPTGVRHRNPDAAGRRSSTIPLMPADVRGDLKEGFIDLPKKYDRLVPHTNEFLARGKSFVEAFTRWCELMQKPKGWDWNKSIKPRWRGPYPLPTATAKDEVDSDKSRWYVTAYFTRSSPFWIPMEAYDWLWEQSTTFDVNLRDSAKPWLDLGRGKAVIEDNTPFVNPLEVAEARRQELGLKRKDFLIGPIEEPLGNCKP